jgi:hypothetical protein
VRAGRDLIRRHGRPNWISAKTPLAASQHDKREYLRREMRAIGLGVDEIAAVFSSRYKLPCLEAYRIAQGLTRQQAADSFNAHLMRTGPLKKSRLTAQKLGRYEDASDESLPPLDTLNLLAEVYATNVRNLINFDYRLHPSKRGSSLSDSKSQDSAQSKQSISAVLVGQATAVLAVGAAVIYAAGALSLGLKLWFIQDTWEPVLGQLPHDLILANAISDVIPALIAAMPVYWLYCTWHTRKKDRQWLRQTLVVLASAAILTLTTGLFLLVTRPDYYKNVLRPCWEILPVCFAINLAVISLAVYLLRQVNVSTTSQQLRRFLGVAIVALALIPCAASVYAAFPLPKVVLCGPAFYYSDTDGRHYMIGNLIGSSGQWVYVAETRASNSVAYGRYVSVVPLSAVDLETIGASAECHNLAPVRTGATTHHS